MKKRRLCFTFIEVIVSSTLLFLLLGALFSSYSTIQKNKFKWNNLKWPLLEERYANQRLSKIFRCAQCAPYFFTTESDQETILGTSLVFTFEHGPHPEPKLSSQVLGRLYIDRNLNALCLGVWPIPDPLQKEKISEIPCISTVLLDDVASLKFHFYYPPDPLKPVNPDEVGATKPLIGWQHAWKESYHSLPALLKIELTRGEKKTLFAFDFLHFPEKITYPRL